jgi:hypothetical protein
MMLDIRPKPFNYRSLVFHYHPAPSIWSSISSSSAKAGPAGPHCGGAHPDTATGPERPALRYGQAALTVALSWSLPRSADYPQSQPETDGAVAGSPPPAAFLDSSSVVHIIYQNGSKWHPNCSSHPWPLMRRHHLTAGAGLAGPGLRTRDLGGMYNFNCTSAAPAAGGVLYPSARAPGAALPLPSLLFSSVWFYTTHNRTRVPLKFPITNLKSITPPLHSATHSNP